MPPTTSDILRQEVEFRISSRLSGAPQIGPYLNRGLNLIEFAGAYTWELSYGTVLPDTLGILALGSNVDIGKPIAFNFTDTKQAVTRRKPDQTWASPTGAAPTRYQTWELYASTPNPAQVRFLPALNPAITLDYIYHKVPTPLDGTSATAVPWWDPWMDDVLVDITEAILKRILSMAGWQALEVRSQQLIVEAVKRYSSGRENLGILEAAQRPADKE